MNIAAVNDAPTISGITNQSFGEGDTSSRTLNVSVNDIEFDAAGTAEIGFVAIKPGRYELGVPNARGDSQKVKISIQ